MKIHIAHTLHDKPWGGGNQFLKTLRQIWRTQEIYAEHADDADVLVYNSFPFGDVRRFWQAYRYAKQGKRIVHRIDGPIHLIRNRDEQIDDIIRSFRKRFADVTVFQSTWSRDANYGGGMTQRDTDTVILNAPDSKTFFPPSTPRVLAEGGKIKLIATSWSANTRKGFDIYAYLDRHLDFSRFEMTFVGRSPIAFQNIRHIPACDSSTLANHLREHDIFITASQHDPCSNSLIEALHCGLPAVVRRDGGHPEIVGDGGICFDGESDVVSTIETLVKNYGTYASAINIPSLTQVAEMYKDVAVQVSGRKKRVLPSIFSAMALIFRAHLWRITSSIRNRISG